MDQFSKRNIDKEGLKKKIEDVDEKIPNTSGLFNRRIATEKIQRLKARQLILLVPLNMKPTEITALLCQNLIAWLNQVLIEE